MTQRPTLFFPENTDTAAREAYAQQLAGVIAQEPAEDAHFMAFQFPAQALWVGVDTAANDQESTVPGASIATGISSSFSSAYFVGRRADGEAAMIQWAQDCSKVLNDGGCPEDDDSAVLALWTHPSKELVIVGVVCSGDWAADLEEYLTEYDELKQVAFSGNDNDAVTFGSDFVSDNAEDLPYKELYDIFELIAINATPEWRAELLESVEERAEETPRVAKLLKQYKTSTASSPPRPKGP